MTGDDDDKDDLLLHYVQGIMMERHVQILDEHNTNTSDDESSVKSTKISAVQPTA